jgi:hypothetical protein
MRLKESNGFVSKRIQQKVLHIYRIIYGTSFYGYEGEFMRIYEMDEFYTEPSVQQQASNNQGKYLPNGEEV